MEELTKLILNLLDKFKEYRSILSNGFERPPIFADGCAANLVRKDICDIKASIKDFCYHAHTELPYEYYFETPKELPEDFMVNKDKIISDANWLFNMIMPLHNRLIEKAQFVSAEARGRSEYSYLTSVFAKLSDAIEANNYYKMRAVAVCFDYTVENRYDDLLCSYNKTFAYFDDNQQEQITLIA